MPAIFGLNNPLCSNLSEAKYLVVPYVKLMIELVWVSTDVSGVEEPTGFQDMSQELVSLNTIEKKGNRTYHPVPEPTNAAEGNFRSR